MWLVKIGTIIQHLFARVFLDIKTRHGKNVGRTSGRQETT